jgi:DNA anti-recombination protein RmuC
MLLSRGRIRSIRSCRLTIGLALLTGGSSEALLEQILTPSQFERNVQTKSESLESVEYGIKLPGRVEDADSVVRLPVDSKYPIEDYQRLMEAQEQADPVALEESTKAVWHWCRH